MGMKCYSLHEQSQWPYVATLLPEDLESTARASGALIRHRHVSSAEDLLRVFLAYAVSDLSLKDVAAWSCALDLATITGPGLFYRLRAAEQWLTIVLAQVLHDRVETPLSGFRLAVVDATVVCGPGAKGTEWRLHAKLDALTGRIESVEITDEHGGEGLSRFCFCPSDVVLGDRGYATARGLHAVDQARAFSVVRINPQSMRLCGADKRRIRLLEMGDCVPEIGEKEFEVMVPVPPPKTNKSHKPWKDASAIAWISGRVVAARTRNGDVIWVLTTLPAQKATAVQILLLYRLRWQVELLFKRLKSLLHLDKLPSPRQGPTARSWLLARLIAAAMAEKLVDPYGALSPWGYQLRQKRLHT